MCVCVNIIIKKQNLCVYFTRMPELMSCLGNFFLCFRLWCCCCYYCCFWVLLFRVFSRRRKQVRADRMGIEPGTFRRKGPRDKTLHSPRSRQKSKKIEFVRVCAVETYFNIKQKQKSMVNTIRNIRRQKSSIHFVQIIEMHFNIKQKHDSSFIRF